jgi:hypothetical protein
MILRATMAALAALSWLAVSNHCALGLAIDKAHQSGAASMHGCCVNHVPAQAPPAKDPATPCCQTLQALSVSPAQSFEANLTILVGTPLAFSTTTAAAPPTATANSRLLCAGPPGVETFAESVLQQSLPAHAPPFLG